MLIIAVAALLGLPACVPKKKQSQDTRNVHKNDIMTDVDIPVAHDSMDQFFDEDSGEFALIDELDNAEANEVTAHMQDEHIDLIADSQDFNDFSWVNEEIQETFKTIFFDFDHYEVRKDQEDMIAYNVDIAKKMFQDNPDMTLIIEGHSDHAAGSDAYNLALSEKRALTLKERLVAAGLPADRIKIVGRGSEIPAIVNGKPVHGDRNEQWPNRRDEIRMIAA